jgi:short-subunit dehydrogenase
MRVMRRAGPGGGGLSGKVVVVTGASAGIGRAVALEAGRRGARVALIARSASALEDVRSEIAAAGSRALALPLDVADAQAVAVAAERTEAELGPIDVWINNAMATVFSPASRLRPDEIVRVTEVAYLGTVYGTLAALEAMRRRNRGVIVQVGSALAFRGIPLQAAYCGAKHAIRGFTSSLRAELIHEKSKIRISEVHLPAVNTPQFDWARARISCRPRPVGEIHAPDVAADAILTAALRSRREYWLGASTAQTVLGQVVLPSLMDRLMARMAWEGQYDAAPHDPDAPNNLLEPVPGLHRTAGRFVAEAKDAAPLLDGSAMRVAVILAGALAFFVAGTAFGASRR